MGTKRNGITQPIGAKTNMVKIHMVPKEVQRVLRLYLGNIPKVPEEFYESNNEIAGQGFWNIDLS